MTTEFALLLGGTVGFLSGLGCWWVFEWWIGSDYDRWP